MKIKVLVWQEDDVWCASVPAFKGCHSWGETYEEAIAMITKAAQRWLEVANQRQNEHTQNFKELELSL
jgi:predicted RNase H-like HicB family nuclease